MNIIELTRSSEDIQLFNFIYEYLKNNSRFVNANALFYCNNQFKSRANKYLLK